MNPCNSLFGKWFGHCFKKFLIKESTIGKIGPCSVAQESTKIIIENMNDYYQIRCKRCGCKADE